MQWWEARLSVPLETADAVATLLHEFPEIQGVSMEGAIEQEPRHPEYGEFFAEEIENMDDVTLTVYFPEHVPSASIRARVADVFARVRQAGLVLGEVDPEVTLQLVDETSWENAWKEHFHPIPIGDRLIVVPKWEQATVPNLEERLPIVLEPGMAFGTGTHETTQMCLEALESLPVLGKHVLDVGCGTAVLSIGAARLGAESVMAVDIDPVAVHVAEENIADNGLKDVIDARVGDLLSGFAEDATFDIAIANILRDVVILLAPQVWRRLPVGGTFVSSGYILSQAEQVQRVLEELGFYITARLTKRDWVTLVAVKRK